MGRTKVEVNANELKEAIKLAEANGPLKNEHELALLVADSAWGKANNITHSVVKSRIKEFGLIPITPKGKRGRQAGQKLTEEHKAAMIGGRGKKDVDKSWISAMRKVTPTAYFPIIDKIEESQSLKKIIALKCLDCCNYNKAEIRHCDIKSCSLWAKRPYK